MADNFITPVAAGTTFATKEIAGAQVPKNLIVDPAGADAVGDVAASPAANTILGRLKAIFDRLGEAIAVTISSLPLPAGASTSAKQDNILLALANPFQVTGSFYPPTQPVSGSVSITGSVGVTGTFWQATQPISAASLPLPTGASADATVAAMSAKLPASLGAKVAAASVSVVPASDALFTMTATALPLPSGAASAAKQDEAKTALIDLGPAAAATAIVPHTTNALAAPVKAIYVGTSGDITIRPTGADSDVVFKNVPAGTFIPVKTTHVRITSTNAAADLVGLA